MKFAVGYANTTRFVRPDDAREMAIAAEAVGFESLWTVEHVIWPEQYSSAYPYHPSKKMAGRPSTKLPDPLVWMTWVAAVTSTIRLGTGILILPQRNPLVTAKAVATLDYLSGGRIDLGIGVGWLEEEFKALGVPWSRRGARTDEYITALRAVWAEDSASYHGEFVDFDGISINPKPVNGTVPIVVGGHSTAALRRAVRLGDGFLIGPSSLDELRSLIAELKELCVEAGRDPGELELTAAHPNGLMEDPIQRTEELAEIGIDRALVSGFRLARAEGTEGIETFGRDVIARFS